MMARIEKVSELTPSVVEGILRHSLSDVSLRVLDVSDPEGLGGLNDGYASELKKIVVNVEYGGKQQKIHLVMKSSLQSAESYLSVISGMFVFYRETFWYNTAFPELMKLVSASQQSALLEMMPVVHHASCNYQVKHRNSTPAKLTMSLFGQKDKLQEHLSGSYVMSNFHSIMFFYSEHCSHYTQEEQLDGCLLSRALLCCCCVLAAKPKEKGLILIENLKVSYHLHPPHIILNLKEGEGDKYIDLKAIERSAGGGVKTAHMRMILEALAQVGCLTVVVFKTFIISFMGLGWSGFEEWEEWGTNQGRR